MLKITGTCFINMLCKTLCFNIFVVVVDISTVVGNYWTLTNKNIFRCPFLHRTAGDTERRYHLRYYKTGTCVYETDSKGNCVKNGPHCAFAHGAHDLRPPIYDIRELQTIETPDLKASLSSSSGTPSSLEKDKILAEDPKWNGKLIRNSI